MSEIQSYRDLTAWQKAMDLASRGDEARGVAASRETLVRAQRLNVSSPHASGLHHLSMARGSLHEMETQLMLGQRLGYMPSEQATYLLALSDEVGRLVAGLIRSLRR